ncbi:LysE family translocator [Modicisalibacter coralii]|uniref:LysE family translocator n=1 Tax=Modicisalibacter coralii TaxID=2304602 RepID=UPI00100AD522|nr:LysE family translocator [Halomonas coralii]
MLQQFLLVAGAHFLALLSPGPDFFLILRYAIVRGRWPAALACLGIALANAAFIALALLGLMALSAHSELFLALQLAGAGFLIYMGVSFLRHAGRTRLGQASVDAGSQSASLGALAAGLASGLLNPKNALFYASLFALLNARDTPPTIQGLYAVWMVGVVLGWDLLVARMAGHPRLIQRLGRGLKTIERLAGLALLLLALGIVASQRQALWALLVG